MLIGLGRTDKSKGLTMMHAHTTHDTRHTNSCAKKGFLHMIVAADDFHLESPPDGEATLTAYTFNTQTARHLFCPTCGVQSFYRPRSHPEGYSVNARCLDGGVPDGNRHPIRPFDGQNWEQNVGGIR